MQHTVLVVEDELLIQLAMVEHLEECGYLTHQAANAHDALAILATILISKLFLPTFACRGIWMDLVSLNGS
jgi:CheY-like chemotaxis protein